MYMILRSQLSNRSGRLVFNALYEYGLFTLPNPQARHLFLISAWRDCQAIC
ncbi:MAG: hypothetical protein JWP69_1562 [Flaviaesturariibacter sp.]|nr:hypothetical protein [Flaviaesturariibacter sp.]